MRSRYSFATALVSWLLLVSSDCAVDHLTDDSMFHVSAFSPSELAFRATSRRMRDSEYVRHIPLQLNREYTRLYLDDVDGFRAKVDAHSLANNCVSI